VRSNVWAGKVSFRGTAVLGCWALGWSLALLWFPLCLAVRQPDREIGFFWNYLVNGKGVGSPLAAGYAGVGGREYSSIL